MSGGNPNQQTLPWQTGGLGGGGISSTLPPGGARTDFGMAGGQTQQGTTGLTDITMGGYNPTDLSRSGVTPQGAPGGGGTDSGGYGVQTPMGTYGFPTGSKTGPSGGMNAGGGYTNLPGGLQQMTQPMGQSALGGGGGADAFGNPLVGAGNTQTVSGQAPAATGGGLTPPYALPGGNYAPSGFTYDPANPMAYLQNYLGAGVDPANFAAVQQAITNRNMLYNAAGQPVMQQRGWENRAMPASKLKDLMEEWSNLDRGGGPSIYAQRAQPMNILAQMNALYPGYFQGKGGTQYGVLTGQIDPRAWNMAPQSVNKMGQWINPNQGVGTWMPMPGNWGGYPQGISPSQYFAGAGGSTPSPAAINASIGNAGIQPWF